MANIPLAVDTAPTLGSAEARKAARGGGGAGWGQAFDSAPRAGISLLSGAARSVWAARRCRSRVAGCHRLHPNAPPSASGAFAFLSGWFGPGSRRGCYCCCCFGRPQLPKATRGADPASRLSGKVGGAARPEGRGNPRCAGRVRSVWHRSECVSVALRVPRDPHRERAGLDECEWQAGSPELLKCCGERTEVPEPWLSSSKSARSREP